MISLKSPPQRLTYDLPKAGDAPFLHKYNGKYYLSSRTEYATADNIVPNTAPTLAAISNRVVTLGQHLSLTVCGSDSDVPAQTLTYTLTNAPAGAQIGAGSGVLTWTPSNAPATNTFTIVVSDNGTPSLTASRAFTVTVVLPPALGGFTVSGSDLNFRWLSALGVRYQVESKSDLNDPEWTPEGGVRDGTGGILTISTPLDEDAHRFFRLRVLP